MDFIISWSGSGDHDDHGSCTIFQSFTTLTAHHITPKSYMFKLILHVPNDHTWHAGSWELAGRESSSVGSRSWDFESFMGTAQNWGTRWRFQAFYIFTRTWGNDPIWLYNIFQMGQNHQLRYQFRTRDLWIFIPIINFWGSFWVGILSYRFFLRSGNLGGAILGCVIPHFESFCLGFGSFFFCSCLIPHFIRYIIHIAFSMPKS